MTLCINNSTCNACALVDTRQRVVNGSGDPASKIWIIGRDPGVEEDACGIPFVGRSGQRLRELLGGLIGQVYIVNLVRCHTPGNKGPTHKQMEACYPFLLLEIAEHKPEILVLLGSDVASFFFGKKVEVEKYRGDFYHDVDLEIPIVVTYHPSFLLRNGHKFDQKFMDDLTMAAEYGDD